MQNRNKQVSTCNLLHHEQILTEQCIIRLVSATRVKQWYLFTKKHRRPVVPKPYLLNAYILYYLVLVIYCNYV